MAQLAIEGGPKAVTLKSPSWPAVGEEEITAVVDGLRKAATNPENLSSSAGTGPVKEFEERFAAFMGARYAMTTCGGGPALHIAVMAAEVQAGDEVIVSCYTWGQTVSCILQQNAIPVFADIDPLNYNLDPKSVEARITPRTKAIIVVHLYGLPADMDPILAIAKRHGLRVIEDCAQAGGALYKGRRVGAIGDLGCHSIGDGKQMIGGEGGVLLTSDDLLWQRAHLYGMHPARSIGVVTDESLMRYIDSLIYTYRIHPVACMIAGVQLKYLDEWNDQRRHNYEMLSKGLEEIPGILPPQVPEDRTHVYHMYCPSFVPEEVEGIARETYVETLQAEGVSIGLGYVRKPIHLRRWFQERNYFYGKHCPWQCTPAASTVTYKPGDCPVAEDRCARTELTLGGHSSWRGDQSALVRQYLDAFAKVAENLDVLRRREREKSKG